LFRAMVKKNCRLKRDQKRMANFLVHNRFQNEGPRLVAPPKSSSSKPEPSGAALNQLLFADDLVGLSEETSKRLPEVVRDIEVSVRHAVQENHPYDEEVRVTVKSNATMKTVKEALIKHLGKPELLQTCRLVQRVGENGAFSGFKDFEKLNNRRALLVLGIPSSRTADPSPPSPPSPRQSEQSPPDAVQVPTQRPAVARVARQREPPKLTVPRALALERDLLQGFSDADFQSKWKASGLPNKCSQLEGGVYTSRTDLGDVRLSVEDCETRIDRSEARADAVDSRAEGPSLQRQEVAEELQAFKPRTHETMSQGLVRQRRPGTAGLCLTCRSTTLLPAAHTSSHDFLSAAATVKTYPQ